MKRFVTRLLVILLLLTMTALTILPLTCFPNTGNNLKNCHTMFNLHEITKRKQVEKETYARSSQSPVLNTELLGNYDFKRELEYDRKDRFERRKEEMLFKLEMRKAHVYDKSIDIFEPLPTYKEELEKIRKYYNLSSNMRMVLNSKFLIESKLICSEKPELMVLVPSIPTNEHIRRAIRSTYGSVARYTLSEIHRFGLEHPVKMAFLLGRSPNKTVDNNLKKEQERYQDIVQTDFVDSYYNLTLKVLYGLKWVNLHCNDAKYVLKADEDVFVNIRLLLAELNTYRISTRGSVFGYIFSSYYDLKVLKTGKWGVVASEYPLRRYPPYAQGTSYTLTGNLVPKIVEISQHLPYLHIEDALITGIIAGKILGANLERINGNSMWSGNVPDPCQFVKTERVSQTNMKPPLMYKTWQALISPNTLCANTTYRPIQHRYNMKKGNI